MDRDYKKTSLPCFLSSVWFNLFYSFYLLLLRPGVRLCLFDNTFQNAVVASSSISALALHSHMSQYSPRTDLKV